MRVSFDELVEILQIDRTEAYRKIGDFLDRQIDELGDYYDAWEELGGITEPHYRELKEDKISEEGLRLLRLFEKDPKNLHYWLDRFYTKDGDVVAVYLDEDVDLTGVPDELISLLDEEILEIPEKQINPVYRLEMKLTGGKL